MFMRNSLEKRGRGEILASNLLKHIVMPALVLCLANEGYAEPPIKSNPIPRQTPPEKPASISVRPKNSVADSSGQLPVPTPKMQPENPIRIGGVYLAGLSDEALQPNHENAPGKLSKGNRDWIAANMDIIALSWTDIEPATFPTILKTNKLFTPLLFVSASSEYEQERTGSVGGWTPAMREWTLKDANGKEISHPESGGHWMDYENPSWVQFWISRINSLSDTYGAIGVVASEPPLSVPIDKFSKDLTQASKTTLAWLKSVKPSRKVMLAPSSVGFEVVSRLPIVRKTPGEAPDIPDDLHENQLIGRLWNAYFPHTEGAWSEGWLRPYWSENPVSEQVWEMQVEAADRASFSFQPFIAAAAYKNASQLEFALASYLLVAKSQGRVVFQPMPVFPNQSPDAGLNLAVLRREMTRWKSYFRVPLGLGIQQRHQIQANGGLVWRRRFSHGEVYVNSSASNTTTIDFGGKMKRLDGTFVRSIRLSPQTGAILRYPNG